MFFLRKTITSFLLFILFGTSYLAAQQNLHQLIIASGGAYSDPTDYVSVSAYSPQNQSTSFIGEIQTQAVQDVLIDGNRFYVAATDSIVVFDLDNNQRISSVAVSGVRYFAVYNDLLFVSIQYPETSNFLRVFDKNTLAQIGQVSEITGEAAAMAVYEGKLYIAVPGDWTSTIGRLAVVNAESGTFIEEIELGVAGVGIHDIFVYNDKILSVNRSSWGGASGTLTLFDPLTKQVNHYSFPYHIGKGVGIREHQLYVSLNNGIGAIDLENWQVTNSSLVSDPGSSSFVYFADIVLDTLNSQLFATTTDYFSMGQGFIFDLNGIQIGSFVAGISAEALALDYRTISSFAEILSNHVEVFPNPATSKIIITSNLKGFFETIKIYNAHGQLVKILERSLSPKFEIEVSDLFPGIYVIVVATERSEVAVSNFIKQ